MVSYERHIFVTFCIIPPPNVTHQTIICKHFLKIILTSLYIDGILYS